MGMGNGNEWEWDDPYGFWVIPSPPQHQEIGTCSVQIPGRPCLLTGPSLRLPWSAIVWMMISAPFWIRGSTLPSANEAGLIQEPGGRGNH